MKIYIYLFIFLSIYLLLSLFTIHRKIPMFGTHRRTPFVPMIQVKSTIQFNLTIQFTSMSRKR